MSETSFDEWYGWFTKTLNRNQADAKKTMILHLVREARREIGEWLRTNQCIMFDKGKSLDELGLTLTMEKWQSLKESLLKGEVPK